MWKLVVGSLVGAAALPSFNESRTWEVMLPCRDGINLHTRIVMPKEDDGMIRKLHHDTEGIRNKEVHHNY